MNDLGFHRAFEGRRRGMRESISSRLEVYLPLIVPLQRSHPSGAAIDLGGGCAEWLELLQRYGFRVQGVDARGDRRASLVERGFEVAQGGTVECLEALPDASQAVVSAFRVEPIAFEDLQALLVQALRVLVPAGLLILETSDSEKRSVDTPTRGRSVSPALLAFLSEYHGFARVGIREPQGRAEPRGTQTIDSRGVPHDSRAVVAQKAAAPEVLRAFDAAFAELTPVDPDAFALREDRARAGDAADVLRERLETRVREAEAERDALRTQLETRLLATEAARDAMLQSGSWRVTAPLRLAIRSVLQAASLLRRSARAALVHGMALLRRLLVFVMSRVLRRPQLSERVNQWLLGRFPGLHARLIEVAATSGVIDRSRTDADHPAGSQAAHDGFSEFVAGFLSIPDGELLPPMLRRLSRFHGCQPEERVSGFAGIHLDHELLHALQVADVVQSRAYDPDADAACGRQLIRHVYLALLRRYPSRADEDRYLTRLAKGEPIEAVIAGVRKSTEYQSILRCA